MSFNSENQGIKEADLSEFREIFALVDKDMGGTITRNELGELMSLMGISITDDEMTALFQEVDKDGDGHLDFNEFVAIISRKVDPAYTKDQVKNAFLMFKETSNDEAAVGEFEHDSLGKGKVAFNSLLQGILQYSTDKDMTESKAKKLLSQLDFNSAGIVDILEYIDLMMN